MLSDFSLITHHFEDNNDIHIYPISDVHLGAAEHMTREWEQFCKGVLADPCAYITLGGDLINNTTRSSVSNIFEETMRPREQKKLMAEMLAPLRDRILCAVMGNHEARNKDTDDDPTYDILCKLDLEHLYRQNMAFVKIQIGNAANDGTRNPTYVIYVQHGSGGGIYPGASLNRFERTGYYIDGIDVAVFGHVHKPFVSQPAKIKVDTRNNVVKIVPFKVVSATSWMTYGGYAAQKMLLPSSHALQTITLCGTAKRISVSM